MSLIFVFVDGVGLDKPSKENPLSQLDLQSFQTLTGGQSLTSHTDAISEKKLIFKPIDARLGVDGLPQSGTGQVTMFSGGNASKVIGKHFGPYPHSKTKFLIEEKSLFKQVLEKGKSPYFMNAFPEIFFDHAKKRNRWSTTTFMTKSAGLQINGENEVRNEKALTAEIFQDVWRQRLDIDLPAISPEQATSRVLNQAETKDVILIEYYLTDKAGHAQNFDDAKRALERLDIFLSVLIKNLKETDTLILTSDHGNVEDLSTKTHTMNDVPLIAYGFDASAFSEVKSLIDITPAIMDFFSR